MWRALGTMLPVAIVRQKESKEKGMKYQCLRSMLFYTRFFGDIMSLLSKNAHPLLKQSLAAHPRGSNFWPLQAYASETHSPAVS